MSIPVSNGSARPAASEAPQQSNRTQVKDKEKDLEKEPDPVRAGPGVDGPNKVKDAESPASAVARMRASANSAIVQTQMSVALSSGNDPLALMLKAAINGINEALAPTMGKDAIENAAATEDNSPEATAGRILSLSTAFYGAYLEQNKVEDNAASRGRFVELIRGGFERGFKEAQDVLQGLNALQGEVATQIDTTYDLVMQGYDDFAAGPAERDTTPTAA